MTPGGHSCNRRSFSFFKELTIDGKGACNTKFHKIRRNGGGGVKIVTDACFFLNC